MHTSADDRNGFITRNETFSNCNITLYSTPTLQASYGEVVSSLNRRMRKWQAANLIGRPPRWELNEKLFAFKGFHTKTANKLATDKQPRFWPCSESGVKCYILQTIFLISEAIGVVIPDGMSRYCSQEMKIYFRPQNG